MSRGKGSGSDDDNDDDDGSGSSSGGGGGGGGGGAGVGVNTSSPSPLQDTLKDGTAPGRKKKALDRWETTKNRSETKSDGLPSRGCMLFLLYGTISAAGEGKNRGVLFLFILFFSIWATYYLDQHRSSFGTCHRGNGQQNGKGMGVVIRFSALGSGYVDVAMHSTGFAVIDTPPSYTHQPTSGLFPPWTGSLTHPLGSGGSTERTRHMYF
ncbi:hypothetical protein VTJ04DRAFT_8833 [Mycothermus thermophilus]|uniref:uncharacterized protein n=1 Tax=Humicola insolens TaxID=85995 RepID=UPI003742F383